MQLSELLTECGYILRDPNNDHWSAAELKRYINNAQLEFITHARYPRRNVIVQLTASTSVYSRPSDLLEITAAWFDGREIKVITKTELSKVVARELEGASVSDIVTVFGSYSNPYGTSALSTTADTVQYIVMRNRTDDVYAVYPPPEQDDIYYDFDETGDGDDDTSLYGAWTTLRFTPRPGSPLFSATQPSLYTGESEYGIITSDSITSGDTPTAGMLTSLEFPKYLLLEGVYNPPTLSADEDTPVISSKYHIALIWGAVSQAYQKEDEINDLNKSAIFREKFLVKMEEAKREEAITPIRFSGSQNVARFRLNRTNY